MASAQPAAALAWPVLGSRAGDTPQPASTAACPSVPRVMTSAIAHPFSGFPASPVAGGAAGGTPQWATTDAWPSVLRVMTSAIAQPLSLVSTWAAGAVAAGATAVLALLSDVQC